MKQTTTAQIASETRPLPAVLVGAGVRRGYCDRRLPAVGAGLAECVGVGAGRAGLRGGGDLRADPPVEEGCLAGEGGGGAIPYCSGEGSYPMGSEL